LKKQEVGIDEGNQLTALLYWKILVVDDDEEDFLLVKSILSSLEQVAVDWVWARTAQEGLRQLEAGRFDAILIDYYLGSEHGPHLIQTAVEAGVQPPMILLSGQGNYEMDREAMQSGAYFFLNKNELTPYVMERTIRYAIDRKAIELALKQREDKLRLLAELSKGFVEAGLSYRQVLDTIASRVSQTFYDAIVIRIQDKSGVGLEPAAACHPDPIVCEQLVNLLGQNQDDRLLEEIAQPRQGRILRRADWSSLPAAVHSPFSSWLDRQHILNLLAVPLQVQYKLLGVMILMRTRHKPDFQADDIEFFQELADRASLSIENARLYVEEAEQTRLLQARTCRHVLEGCVAAVPVERAAAT